MIKRLARFLASYFAYKGQYDEKEINIYTYGFELLLSTILNAIGLLIISSLFMGSIIEAVLFSMAFIPLRVYAGGYHTKHHWSCFLLIISVFIFYVIIINHMVDSIILPYITFSTLLSSILIWFFSPIGAANNPLSEEQKNKYRKRSIIITVCNIVLAFIFIFVPQLTIAFFLYYQSGALFASISLAIAKAARKYKLNTYTSHST